MYGLNRAVVDEILEHGNLYEVGGYVRDSLRGVDFPEKDRDYLVTKIEFDRLVRILTGFGQVDLVGRSFGVIKFTASPNGIKNTITYDIALPRSEFSTGSGHRDFKVDFDHKLPIEEDLLRRDFTINAMARDLRTGEILDPFGGGEDLKNGLIRMLRPDTFKDDPLRMMRAIQFAARFEFQIEPQTFAAIVENVDLITTISPERIQEELNKMLTRAQKPSIGFILMKECGMLKKILPELAETVDVDQPGGYHAHDVFTHSINTVDQLKPSLVVRLAGLLHDVAKPPSRTLEGDRAHFYGHEVMGAKMASEVLSRLRFSNHVIEDVMALIRTHMFTSELSDKGVRRLIRKVGPELVFDLLDLRRADVIAQGMGNTTPDIDLLEKRIHTELDNKTPLGLSQLAVNGNDIMQEFNLRQSPHVGEILNHLLDYVLEFPDQNEKEILMDIARKYMQDKERE
ncbi:MAG: HD domain-containing protein [candidate division Zixibacteria bacterium]|nr:HD domain-containing protein [candidate division Zixibacteria bacterium]